MNWFKDSPLKAMNSGSCCIRRVVELEDSGRIAGNMVRNVIVVVRKLVNIVV
jgi:hypothetical protein